MEKLVARRLLNCWGRTEAASSCSAAGACCRHGRRELARRDSVQDSSLDFFATRLSTVRV
jgi:hypothetical protein